MEWEPEVISRYGNNPLHRFVLYSLKDVLGVATEKCHRCRNRKGHLEDISLSSVQTASSKSLSIFHHLCHEGKSDALIINFCKVLSVSNFQREGSNWLRHRQGCQLTTAQDLFVESSCVTGQNQKKTWRLRLQKTCYIYGQENFVAKCQHCNNTLTLMLKTQHSIGSLKWKILHLPEVFWHESVHDGIHAAVAVCHQRKSLQKSHMFCWSFQF